MLDIKIEDMTNKIEGMAKKTDRLENKMFLNLDRLENKMVLNCCASINPQGYYEPKTWACV